MLLHPFSSSSFYFSGSKLEPAFGSISANMGGGSTVVVVAEAHRVVSGGALSGYDLNAVWPTERLAAEKSSGESTGTAEKMVEDVVFEDISTSSASSEFYWRGTVSAYELPGGGLHRHVRLLPRLRCFFNSGHFK